MRRLARFAIALTCLFVTSYDINAFADGVAKAKMVELTGEVRFKNPTDTDWQSAAVDTELLEGAHVFVGPDSDCQLAFGDDFKSVTRIKQDSHIILRSMSGQPKIDILSGELFALVRNLKKDSPFQVTTPTAVATVRGTAFSFAADGIGAEMDSTLEVFEHTVGLNPLDKPGPENELPVNEGQGVVMGADGTIEKQFELSVEDLQAGREFVERSVERMQLDQPVETQASPKEEAADETPAEDASDDKMPGGPTPPGPQDGPESNDPSKLDSAMDGVVMDMANESEFSRSENFNPAAMSRMMDHFSEMNYDGGEGGPPEDGGKPDGPQMDPDGFSGAMRDAFRETDHFKSQPPDVQERMMESMETYADKFNDMNGPDSTMPMPDGPGMTDGPGDRGPMDPMDPMGSTFMDPYSGGMMMEGMDAPRIDPNDLASFVNEGEFETDREKISIINFMDAIRNDYWANHTNGSYFSAVQTIPNFTFVKDDIAYTGTIYYDPNSVHTHSVNGDFLHLDDVYIDDGASNVIVDPPIAPEVKIS